MRTDNTTDWLTAALQSDDPLFVSEVYPHPIGLASFLDRQSLRDEAVLLAFLKVEVVVFLQQAELPILGQVFEATTTNESSTLQKLNSVIEAWPWEAEAREASLRLGERRLQAARKMFHQPIMQEVAGSLPRPHHLFAYGLQMAVSGAPLHAALTGYYYQALAGACRAAGRMPGLEPEAIKRVLRESLRDAEDVIQASLEVWGKKALGSDIGAD